MRLMTAWALTYTRGRVWTWLRNEKGKESDAPWTLDWEIFKKKMKDMWHDRTDRLEAIRRMRYLRQGGNSVQDYTQQFDVLEPLTEWDERALVDHYKFGLNKEIAHALADKSWDNLDQLKAIAINLDVYHKDVNRSERRPTERSFPERETQKGKKGFNANRRRDKKSHTRTVTVGSINQKGTKDPKGQRKPNFRRPGNSAKTWKPKPKQLTDSEKERYRRENKCYECGSTEHYASWHKRTPQRNVAVVTKPRKQHKATDPYQDGDDLSDDFSDDLSDKENY